MQLWIQIFFGFLLSHLFYDNFFSFRLFLSYWVFRYWFVPKLSHMCHILLTILLFFVFLGPQKLRDMYKYHLYQFSIVKWVPDSPNIGQTCHLIWKNQLSRHVVLAIQAPQKTNVFFITNCNHSLLGAPWSVGLMNIYLLLKAFLVVECWFN